MYEETNILWNYRHKVFFIKIALIYVCVYIYIYIYIHFFSLKTLPHFSAEISSIIHSSFGHEAPFHLLMIEELGGVVCFYLFYLLCS